MVHLNTRNNNKNHSNLCAIFCGAKSVVKGQLLELLESSAVKFLTTLDPGFRLIVLEESYLRRNYHISPNLRT